MEWICKYIVDVTWRISNLVLYVISRAFLNLNTKAQHEAFSLWNSSFVTEIGLEKCAITVRQTAKHDIVFCLRDEEAADDHIVSR